MDKRKNGLQLKLEYMKYKEKMTISKDGSDLIREFERFRNHPYIDAVGKPTIGWGNTFWEDMTPVKMTDAPIKRKRGDELNTFWLRQFESDVLKLVNVKLNQYQFDALVSFAYNVGTANLKSSTLLKRVNNDPNDLDISYQFKRWNKGRVRGVLQVLNGLTKRRKEEAGLYFKCVR
jgi:lysozyme